MGEFDGMHSWIETERLDFHMKNGKFGKCKTWQARMAGKTYGEEEGSLSLTHGTIFVKTH